MKKIVGLTLAGALTLGFGGLPAHAQGEQAPTPEVTWPQATEVDGMQNNAVVNVMVMLKKQPNGQLDKKTGTAAVSVVAKRWSGKPGVKIRRSFGLLVRGFSATVPASLVDQIAKDPDVASVTPLQTYQQTMGTAGELTKSIQARKNKGIDGRGMVVSIIDSGIDVDHKDLRLDDDAKASAKMPVSTTTRDGNKGWTAKVPFGWNFADGNNIVKDTGSQHGMHVAGIVAANGTDAEVASGDAVDGIAPNAQLLAMKVFSNDPFLGGGASEDDIIAAIEKSVELKADVINMSLGSPNGLTEGGVGEGRAVAEAAKAGVEVLIAAGNDGLNFDPSGTMNDASGLLDNGTMASPGSAPDAFTIASVNNSHAMATSANYNGTPFTYSHAIGEADNQPHVILDCGFGKPEQIPAEAKGNYCLIQRGDGVTFADKFKNAIAAGATGVLIYNNQGESFVGMGGLDGMAVFGASVYQSVGEAIKAEIAKGETKVTFSSKMVPQPKANVGTPSDFTSFGATPELEFKPQLAGIGGNVWSTANDNGYQDMSGTSMATPHVAGIFALGLQYYKQQFPTMSANERGAQLRVALSNTAQILKQPDGVPYSARQQGAGLAQTDTALNSHVFATVNGKPNVTLKQMDAAKSFTVTLTNKAAKEATFTTGATCVINESQVAGKPLTTVCGAEETITADKASVTVPANGTATVTYTVTPKIGTRHWVSGWGLLTSADEATQPSLSMPFMGFVGDWNAEPIVDAPKGQTGAGKLVALGAKAGNETMLATDEGTMIRSMYGNLSFISPNGDGMRDTVFGSYALLRSAKQMRFSVLDSKGQKIADLATINNLQRRTIYKLSKGIGNTRSNAQAWDGKVYDSATDTYKAVPDGEYTYRAEACLGLDDRCQVVDQKVKTDTVAPTMTTSQRPGVTPGTTILDVVVTDGGPLPSGVSGYNGLTITDAQTGAVIKATSSLGKWSVSLPAGTKMVKLTAVDYAGNSVEQYVSIGDAQVFGFTGKAAFDGWINHKTADPVTKAPLVVDDSVELPILASASVTEGTYTVTHTPLPTAPNQPAAAPTTESGKVTLTDGKGKVKISLVEGTNEVKLVAKGTDGTEVTDTIVVKYDDTAPVVTWTNKAEITNADGTIKLDADGSVTVKGTVWDARAKQEMATGADGQLDPMGSLWVLTISENKIVPLTGILPDGTFEITITPDATDSQVELFFLDGFDLITNNMMNVGAIREEMPLSSTGTTAGSPLYTRFFDERFDGASPDTEPMGGGIYILDRTYDIEVADGKAVLHLGGSFNRAPGSFKVNGRNAMVRDTLWLADIPLNEGVTSVPFELRDSDGSLVSATVWKFLYDKTLPSYELATTPEISPDGAIWFNGETAKVGKVDLKGTVSDNAFGYTFKVNGSVIKDFESIWDPKEEINKREYSTSVGVTNGFIRLGLNDFTGNRIERSIPVHTDAVAPVVTIDGVSGNVPVLPTATVSVKASDDHLRDLKVTVDGKPAEVRLAKVQQDPGAKVVKTYTSDPSKEIEVIEGGDAITPETVLTYELVKPLADGNHQVVATATDMAGNKTDQMVSFTVNGAPIINGPASATLNPDDGDLLTQIQKIWTVTDDEALKVSADVSQLKLGQPVKLTLTAVDSKGNKAEKVVTITLDRPEVTLTGECGSMKGKFPKGETIKITCTKNADGTTTVVVKNSGATPIMGQITLKNVTGPIEVLDDKGNVVGTIDQATTFVGSSQATYRFGTPVVVKPTDPTDPTDPKPEKVTHITRGTVLVGGVGRVGETLDAITAGFQPASVKFTYQWARNGKPIAGATKQTYTVTTADLGTRLSVRVTATYPGVPSITQGSDATEIVGLGVIKKGTVTISGQPKVGATATATARNFTPGTTFTYQWAIDGKPVAGATKATFVIPAAAYQHWVSVRVTATKAGYTAAVQGSSALGPIGSKAVIGAPVKIVGTPTVGQVLKSSTGVWVPSNAKLSYQWYRNGKAIPGATAWTYRLTAADRGARISLRITGTAAGLTSTVRGSDATAIVK